METMWSSHVDRCGRMGSIFSVFLFRVSSVVTQNDVQVRCATFDDSPGNFQIIQ